MKKFKSLIFLLLAINVFALADNDVNSKKLEITLIQRTRVQIIYVQSIMV